jgi:hypothetical protein
LGYRSLKDFTDVFQEMPAVEHLSCMRGALARAARIPGSSIPTDDLDSRIGK